MEPGPTRCVLPSSQLSTSREYSHDPERVQILIREHVRTLIQALVGAEMRGDALGVTRPSRANASQIARNRHRLIAAALDQAQPGPSRLAEPFWVVEDRSRPVARPCLPGPHRPSRLECPLDPPDDPFVLGASHVRVKRERQL